MFHSRVSNKPHFLIKSEYDVHKWQINKLKLDREDFLSE